MNLLTEVTVNDQLLEVEAHVDEEVWPLYFTLTPKATKEDVAKAIWSAANTESGEKQTEGMIFSQASFRKNRKKTPFWAVGRRGGTEAQRTFWKVSELVQIDRIEVKCTI